MSNLNFFFIVFMPFVPQWIKYLQLHSRRGCGVFKFLFSSRLFSVNRSIKTVRFVADSIVLPTDEFVLGTQTSSVVRRQSTSVVVQSLLSGQCRHIVDARRRLCRSSGETSLGHAREEPRTSRPQTSSDRQQRRTPSRKRRERRCHVVLHQPHRVSPRGEQVKSKDVRLGLSTRERAVGFDHRGNNGSMRLSVTHLSLRCSSCDVTDVSVRVKTRRNRWSIYSINIYKTR